jgi:hypothetical protein
MKTFFSFLLGISFGILLAPWGVKNSSTVSSNEFKLRNEVVTLSNALAQSDHDFNNLHEQYRAVVEKLGSPSPRIRWTYKWIIPPGTAVDRAPQGFGR